MWQPIGVVAASGIAYGTAAKYRCDTTSTLKSCHQVPSGTPCCTVSSNMGWRYLVIVLGGVTLIIFCLRYFVFHFHESPKFLLSRGKEAEAIEVLHRIAKFNRAPPPTLTIDKFIEIDEEADAVAGVPKSAKDTTRHVVKNFFNNFKHLKGIFLNKLQLFIFILLALAYMGDYWSFNLAGSKLCLLLRKKKC